VKRPASENERSVLIHDLREAYMEIFPAPGIEKKLKVLDPNSYVAVTCSPSKGVDETLDLTEKLISADFRVVPHIAARNVRDREHLGQIMKRLGNLRIGSIFVPGGDRPNPEGEFTSAWQLLSAIDEIDHEFIQIGVGAHPEGHPDVDKDTLFRELEKKQSLCHYMVTQMCFDADILGSWLREMRSKGITLPVWIGLPGVIDRSRLLAASFRIGVGDSLRYLRKKPNVAAQLMKSSTYYPDELVSGLAKYQADPECNIAGYHLFCFNQVETTESWRHASIEALE
jgi:methylenetetrahydrofolate reductase (NADPH)